MHLDNETSDLLATLYEGPLEARPWQTFLARIRELLAADLVTLVLRTPSEEDRPVMLADGGSMAAMESYNRGQFMLDPFVDLPPRQVHSLHEYLSTEVLLASDFYRIIMEPEGWYDFLGVDIREDHELDLRFRIGRYKGAAPFAEREKQLVAALLPHLERSVRLQTRLSRSERERAVYAGAIEQLSVASIILDEQGRVFSANIAAEEMLRRGDVIHLVNGYLELVNRKQIEELREMLGTIRRGRQDPQPAAASAMQLSRTGEGQDLGLVARALPPGEGVEGRGSPSIAIFINDPELAAEPPQQVIGRLFGLTPSESNLALLLARGLTIDEASETLGVSRNTVRAHLRSVFSKTGVTRQTGLVRLILNSVAPLAGGGSQS